MARALIRVPRQLVSALALTVACATAGPTAPPPPALLAPQAATVSPPVGLAQRARGAASALQARDARALIDAALREGAAERWQQRRAAVFSDGGAVFMLDDAWSLLAQAPRPRRARLLAAMAPALTAQDVIDRDERARVAAAAAAAGLEVGELYARRAALDARALLALADGALASTAVLLGPVAGDATLLPDVLAPPSWLIRRAPTRPAGAIEPSTGWALHYGSAPRPSTTDDAAAWARALTVEMRLTALSVRALLTPAASPAQLDALASRALLEDAEVLAGAAVLLDTDASGAVVERFIGLLRAPGVTRALWSGENHEVVVRRLEAAPSADEEGYPEAFVAVARSLPESL